MLRHRHVSRRRFLGAAAAAAGGVLLPGLGAHAARVAPSDKVRIGIIGTGGMGRAHMYSLAQNPQCTIVALCDAFANRYEEVVGNVEKITGARPDTYQDFRQVLDRKDIDAVFVVTPDHWHPLMTIYACRAGKDVYVEKPVCTTIEEGRAMVETARRYGRVVQVGTQQRSMPVFQEAMELIHGGYIGKVTTATAWVGTNGTAPGETPENPPEGLDWDMWLGPAPWMPYSPQRHYGWMGWQDYAKGGELTNWGVHLLDIVHWGIGQDRPLNVQATGGNYRQYPGAENYESIDAIFEYPGVTVTWEQRHNNTYQGKGYGMKFFGTDGQILMDRGTYVVKRGSEVTEERMFPPETTWANTDHHNNFFDCVRSRQKPAADIEQGFRSTAVPLMAGIALKTRRRLEWDGARERFIGDDEANRYLSKPYRQPWQL